MFALVGDAKIAQEADIVRLLLKALSVINIPDMPESISGAVTSMSEYLATGYGILDNL